MICIHHYEGDFSDRWIEFCKKNNLPFKIVDALSNTFLEEIKDCSVFMWPINLSQVESLKSSKEIFYYLNYLDIKTFPNFEMVFLYDNKIAQKYLFEVLDIPHVKSYIFYKLDEALAWIDKTTFPKVFKLSSGAGSNNVKLCKNKKEARKLIKRAFSNGFPSFDRKNWFYDRLEKFLREPNKQNFKNFLKATARLFIKTKKEKLICKEKGYVYFQDFLPNKFDIRIIVIGNRAFGIKRLVRHNDFRASGSGNIIYDKNEINLKCVKLAFDISKKMNFPCMGYDFIFDKNDEPLLVEMSYHFAPYLYDKCEGYWDENLNWKDEKVNPQYFIIEDFINENT